MIYYFTNQLFNNRYNINIDICEEILDAYNTKH